ncbi:MAG: hypothetical protein HY295_00115 [Thaumarchaeota archaeon]|nr:hypothetical protein [Nitrososphaerota archaeon]
MQFLAILAIASIFLPTAFGDLSDKTGLKKDFTIKTDGYQFNVVTTASFDIEGVKFSKDEKKLTLKTSSEIENNLAEIQIPLNLIDGDLTVFVNGTQTFPKILKNDKISFLTIEFSGKGTTNIEIIGTTYLPEFSEIVPIILAASFVSMIVSYKIRKF